MASKVGAGGVFKLVGIHTGQPITAKRMSRIRSSIGESARLYGILTAISDCRALAGPSCGSLPAVSEIRNDS